MTLHELTYGLAFLMPLMLAFAEGEKGGFPGILIALLVGLALGIGGFFLTKTVYQRVRQHPELGNRNPRPFWGLLAWALYLMLLTCVVGLGLVGMLATKWLVRLVA